MGSKYSADSKAVLDEALSRVPFYKMWKAIDPGPEKHIDERYRALPILTKHDIRGVFPSGLTPDNMDLDKALRDEDIELATTSGMTGDAVTNLWYQPWWDASEGSSWKMNSHTAGIATGTHREAILTSPLCVGVIGTNRDLLMKERRLDRFLFLNERPDPLTWDPVYMDRMVGEINCFRPEIIEANPSFLAKLARHIYVSGIKVYSPGAIVLTYEMASMIHIGYIKKVFSSPVISSYGSTETGYVFMECEKGKMHQNTEFCRVDFEPLRKEHGGPELGRILVTTFNNPWCYIIRFDIGDLVRMDSDGRCECGRGYGTLLRSIEGRCKNITLTSGGRVVTEAELDRVISKVPGIFQYQLEQVSPTDHVFRIAIDTVPKSAVKRASVDILKRLYGEDVKIDIEFLPELRPVLNVKYRKSFMNPEVPIENFLENPLEVERSREKVFS